MKIKNVILITMLTALSFLFSTALEARVVNVKVSVTPGSFHGKCPKRFEFKAAITSNSRGVVKYQWKRSDGAIAPVRTIRFAKRGTKFVSSYWVLGAQGKHWKAVAILAPNRMMSNRAVFKLKCGRFAVMEPGLRTVTPVKPGRRVIDPGRLVVKPGQFTRACADPAAASLGIRILQNITQFKKRIRITGIVKNIGAKAFLCGPNKAKAYLYEVPIGSSSGRLVAQREIRNLAPGATLQVSYDRNWNTSSPSEGEFPPGYRLMISYDPDIYMDANKNNDDCNQRNNKKELAGVAINRQLRR